jgi:penicillin-binding protein 1A
VIQSGTGRAAAIGQFAAGKTGTTTNYGDAWFVGWDSKYTVAVWVGYPNKLVPMTTAFNGGPVLGGTFPALIWHDFMTSALGIDKVRAEHSPARKGTTGEGHEGSTTVTNEAPATSTPQRAGPSRSPSPAGAGSGNGKGKAPAPNAGVNEASRGNGNQESEHSSTSSAPSPAGQSPASPPPAASTPPPSQSSSPTGGVSPGG